MAKSQRNQEVRSDWLIPAEEGRIKLLYLCLIFFTVQPEAKNVNRLLKHFRFMFKTRQKVVKNNYLENRKLKVCMKHKGGVMVPKG